MFTVLMNVKCINNGLKGIYTEWGSEIANDKKIFAAIGWK